MSSEDTQRGVTGDDLKKEDVAASEKSDSICLMAVKRVNVCVDIPPSDGNNSSVMLPVVKIPVKSGKLSSHQVYALLDSGSSDNFITVGILQHLTHYLLMKNVNLEVTQLGGRRARNAKRVRIHMTCRGHEISLDAYTVDFLLEVPSYSLPWGINRLDRLNDNFPRPPTNIDLLIGNVDMWKILKGRPSRISTTLVLLPTLWGMVPTGADEEQTVAPLPNDEQEKEEEDTVSEENVKAQTFLSGTEKLAQVLERMWKLEEFPLDMSGGDMSRDEVLAVERIEKHLRFDEKRGRFITGLLWREEPDLVNNFGAAKTRLDSLLRKLRKDKELCAAYTSAMQEFFDLGSAEEVIDTNPRDPARRNVFYLPHRAVYDATRASTKCRPVFDASAKTATGQSLNSCLLAGPPLQLSILSIQLRFRLRPIAVVGDISKMFLNIDVRTEDRDYLRFLWKDPLDIHGEPKIFRFTSLIFGATDSPFQAITCLQKLVKDTLAKPDLDPETRHACHIIQNDTYVDDLTTGGNTPEEVLEKLAALIHLLGVAHFFVKKWASNSSKILASLPDDTCSPTEPVDLNRGFDAVSLPISTLGVRWWPKEDYLVFDQFDQLKEENEDSKTSVASLLAKVFDPLGLVSPFTLKARQVMKETFIDKINWKEPLTERLIAPWHEWVNDLPNLSSLHFPRYIPYNETSEVHIFGDGATSCGYGVAVYIRTFDMDKERFVSHLLMAKSRIGPMKEIGVPKLELKACLLAAEIAQQLILDINISKEQIYCYSDNEAALWWLTKEPRVLIPFVANRVEKIRNWGHQFTYIKTDENPADIASRGSDVDGLQCDLWMHGPWFLKEPRCKWPTPKIDWTKVDKSAGVKKAHVFTYQTSVIAVQRGYQSNRKQLCDLVSYYSELKKTLRLTALLYKFIHVLKRRIHGEPNLPGGGVQLSEFLEHSKIYWVHQTQSETFGEDFLALEEGKTVVKSSRLAMLSPFVDRENPLKLPVLRVGGRLAHSDLERCAKHPLILPKSSAYTKALVWGAHLENQHASVDWLHFHLRQEYWILSSRQLLRSTVKQCYRCRKHNATRGQQIMADLPSSRVNPEPGFTHTGVDYTGNVHLRKDSISSEETPGYIAVFTCFSTRAVHLEVVESNTTFDFLLAFKRFINTRGMPRVMYSDNAKTFTRANREICETLASINQVLEQEADKMHFKWKFSTEESPHTGGVWERMVQSVKRPLHRVVRNAFLTYAELSTICKELEGYINDRPLTSALEETMEVITPSMLLLGRKIRPWVDKFASTTLPQKTDIRQRWKHRNAIAQQYWRAWSQEYRTQLQQRAKWFTPSPNIREGDLVLIEVDNVKRGNWPLARVLKVVYGRDKRVRSVHLTKGSEQRESGAWRPGNVLVRSVQRIFPLESVLDRPDAPEAPVEQTDAPSLEEGE